MKETDLTGIVAEHIEAVPAVPAGYDDLLERPLYGHLASIRPDGSIQVSPMWFHWDGEFLRFAHTKKRQKYRNVQLNPHVSMSVSDPDDPYRYLELRGSVVRIDPDPTAAFFWKLWNRYSADKRPADAPAEGEAPLDAADWVVIVVRPTGFSKH